MFKLLANVMVEYFSHIAQHMNQPPFLFSSTVLFLLPNLTGQFETFFIVFFALVYRRKTFFFDLVQCIQKRIHLQLNKHVYAIVLA